MAFEERPGQGALFKNDRKDPGSQQPDSQGSLTCPFCERQIRLAGWTKDGAKGRFVSLKGSEPRTATRRDDADDDEVF